MLTVPIPCGIAVGFSLMALDWLTEDAKVDVHQLSFDSSENSVGSLHNMAYWTEQGSLEGEQCETDNRRNVVHQRPRMCCLHVRQVNGRTMIGMS